MMVPGGLDVEFSRRSRNKEHEPMGGKWTKLPEDLLIDIGKRVKCVEDIYSFSHVCSSWRLASIMVKSKWTPSIPCLILPRYTLEGDPTCAFSMFDLTTNKHCRLEFPEMFGCRYHGCGSGWIVSINPYRRDIKLFNPLTKSTLHLPSVKKLPHQPLMFYLDNNVRGEEEFMRPGLVRRSILVNDEFLVLMAYGFNCLAFAKPGDNAWSFMDCTFNVHGGLITCVQDVIVSNGQILISFGDGKLVGVSLDQFLNDKENLVFEEYVVGDISGDVSMYAQDSPELFYLVESFGDVLVVLQHRSPAYEVRFEVFKVDSRLKKWVRVEDLGDVSLFVGKHSALAVCALNETKCKPNCVCYIDDTPFPNSGEISCIGMFNLKSGKTEVSFRESDPSPFWLMPQFM